MALHWIFFYLHPALELSAQEKHGPVGVCPEQAAKMIKRLEYLPYEVWLRGLWLSLALSFPSSGHNFLGGYVKRWERAAGDRNIT